ncbi:MAG: LysR family transcriptional regulator [Candidatus Latescibacteria bacterium]|nr:LysR family transcriptional regulator [Candidatus Latescibacterota bacterium]
MNLHQLRYFLAVTRAGGFTQAARALHLTQPTVSSGIAELERHLGVKLFNRNGRSVALTLEGRTLLGYALQLEDVLEELEDKLHRKEVPAGEGFRFGAIDAAVIYLLPELLKAYLRDWPQVALAIQVAPSRYLVEELLVNRSEFALITLPFEHPRVQTLALLHDAMPLVVGAEHRFAGRGRVRPDEVVREPLILFHADSVSRKIVDEHFAELGLAPRVVMEMRSPEAMRKLVEARVGISFLPRMVVEESLASGVLKEVPVRGMKFDRQIGLAWRRGRHFGPAIRHLLESILTRYGKLEVWQEQLKKSGG